MPSSSEITQMLIQYGNGDKGVFDQLVQIVYGELRKLASHHIRAEKKGHTIHTTALVHEAYLRLLGQENLNLQNRAHFFGVAANSMRQILIEYARKDNAAKRGSGQKNLPLENADFIFINDSSEFLALDDALTSLQEFDHRKAQIVELRYFTGMTIQETAEILETSPATVKRDWDFAKAWLFREINN